MNKGELIDAVAKDADISKALDSTIKQKFGNSILDFQLSL